MLDERTIQEITAAVRTAIQYSLEDAKEKWVSGDELCKQFQCFTPGWLKRNGKYLDRTRVVIVDNDGNEQKTGWVYPMHRIGRMLREDKMYIHLPR